MTRTEFSKVRCDLIDKGFAVLENDHSDYQPDMAELYSRYAKKIGKALYEISCELSEEFSEYEFDWELGDE